MGTERQSEQFLRAAVEQLHSVQLEPFDCDGRQRAVDYVFTSSAGVAGAVEMTTYRDGRAAAWESKMREGKTITCDSSRGWAVRIRLNTKLDQLRRRLPPVITACDHHGVADPSHLPSSEYDSNPDVEWFMSSGLSLSPSALSPPGTVGIYMPPTAGFPRDENLDRDLDQMLSDKQIASKLDKLRSHTGVTERHLAVGVDAYRPGFDLFDHLLHDHGYVPRLEIPDDFAATHVWITGGYYPMLTWTRYNGWVWRSLPRPDDQ